jgi:hypothetical protein
VAEGLQFAVEGQAGNFGPVLYKDRGMGHQQPAAGCRGLLLHVRISHNYFICGGVLAKYRSFPCGDTANATANNGLASY